MIKGPIQEEDIILINTYTPTTGTPKYIQQILTNIKGEIDGNVIIVRDLSPHSHQWTDPLDRKSIRQWRWHNRKVRPNWYFQDITSKKNQNIHSFQVHIGKAFSYINCTNDMILYIENPKDLTQKLLKLINEFSKVAGNKINIHKTVAFLYSNNEILEKEYKNIPFKISPPKKLYT